MAILYSLNKYQNNSVEVFVKLFDCQIQPIVQYGAEIWGIERGKEIEKLHLFALKKFLHIPSKTPNDIVYGELGRFPLFVNSYVACIRYWLHILQMEECRLPLKCYRVLCKLDSRGKVTWATNVRKCLSNYGFFHVWEQQGVGSVSMFLKCFKQRVIDCRWQEWDAHISDSDRFILYRMFKTTHFVEPYLHIDVNRYIKNALIRLRAGVSIILVHEQRFKSPSEGNFLCRLCGLFLEDEVHFVLCCPCLTDLRSTLIPYKYYAYPSTFRLSLLLSTCNPHVLKNLAIFLYLSTKRLSNVIN